MFQELDLLEAHLEESQHWADRIVIIESPVTFSSVEKPLYFAENRERFSRFDVDYLVTPPDVFEKIPFSYPQEETNRWFRARRDNRNKNRQFHWENLRNGTDYVYLNDVDEFIDSERWGYLKDIITPKDMYYVSIKNY